MIKILMTPLKRGFNEFSEWIFSNACWKNKVPLIEWFPPLCEDSERSLCAATVVIHISDSVPLA